MKWIQAMQVTTNGIRNHQLVNGVRVKWRKTDSSMTALIKTWTRHLLYFTAIALTNFIIFPSNAPANHFSCSNWYMCHHVIMCMITLAVQFSHPQLWMNWTHIGCFLFGGASTSNGVGRCTWCHVQAAVSLASFSVHFDRESTIERP